MIDEQKNKIIEIIENWANEPRDFSGISLENQTIYDIADEVKDYLDTI